MSKLNISYKNHTLEYLRCFPVSTLSDESLTITHPRKFDGLPVSESVESCITAGVFWILEQSCAIVYWWYVSAFTQ